MSDLADTGLSPDQFIISLELDKLTDEERSELFYFYCYFCGRKQYREPSDKNGCTCRRDD
jgi:hypothetical protein